MRSTIAAPVRSAFFTASMPTMTSEPAQRKPASAVAETLYVPVGARAARAGDADVVGAVLLDGDLAKVADDVGQDVGAGSPIS